MTVLIPVLSVCHAEQDIPGPVGVDSHHTPLLLRNSGTDVRDMSREAACSVNATFFRRKGGFASFLTENLTDDLDTDYLLITANPHRNKYVWSTKILWTRLSVVLLAKMDTTAKGTEEPSFLSKTR